MTTDTNAAPDLKTVINFLMGDGPLNGFQFGETPEGAGKYWWRKHLRAALATAAAAVPAIPDAITHTIQRALVKFSDSELERLRTLLEPENAAVAMFGMARIAAQQNIDDADAALNWLAVAPKAEPAPAAQGDALGSHDVREPTAIGCAVNRAARDLPEGWEIRIDLERGAGGVHLTDPEGNETMIDGGGELFSDQINAAIDAARGVVRHAKIWTPKEVKL